MSFRLSSAVRCTWLFFLLTASAATWSQGSATSGSTSAQDGATPGPIRLRPSQPVGATEPVASARPAPKYVPGEFELFVQKKVSPEVEIKRFGAELVTMAADSPLDVNPLVPPDYVLKAGDEVLVTLWGSVDADLRLMVDRNGRITIPRVGPVLVAGVRYADLPGVVSQRVAQVFRNFQVSVSIGQLRPQRIYVTGFVARPGAYSVNPLATVVQALLQAGGPSAAGSFRSIELRRAKERVAEVDLYEFLLGGDRGADRLLQAEDVIHVGPIGTQVAMLGSVNRTAVFELKRSETVADLLRMSGGFSAVADRTRLAVERVDERATIRIAQLELPAAGAASLNNGDIVRAFSAVDAALPVQRQNKRVRVEGEVARPGDYVLPATSTIADALAAAGGMTASAYPFGAEFTRESVRITQQQNYDRALRDLETDLARRTASQRGGSAADEVAAQAGRDSANARLLATLRALKPTGRVVLQLEPLSPALPALALEDGDRLYIPPRPTTVGVFGSVFNAGSYLHGEGRAVDDYLSLAGGPTRGADARSAFVIRANGSVVSGLQQGGLWRQGSSLSGVRAEPGDTVFVPEDMDKTTFVQAAKDWTQILYQFGLGIAGIVAATK